ncbi:hypothetical protein BgiBS90_008583 [Biomphalaria glabrata]|nr:hypothetical protein BgiBS90_008583 [Biomphalaria glabrata]
MRDGPDRVSAVQLRTALMDLAPDRKCWAFETNCWKKEKKEEGEPEAWDSKFHSFMRDLELDVCRKKRNDVDYNYTSFTSP